MDLTVPGSNRAPWATNWSIFEIAKSPNWIQPHMGSLRTENPYTQYLLLEPHRKLLKLKMSKRGKLYFFKKWWITPGHGKRVYCMQSVTPPPPQTKHNSSTYRIEPYLATWLAKPGKTLTNALLNLARMVFSRFENPNAKKLGIRCRSLITIRCRYFLMVTKWLISAGWLISSAPTQCMVWWAVSLSKKSAVWNSRVT